MKMSGALNHVAIFAGNTRPILLYNRMPDGWERCHSIPRKPSHILRITLILMCLLGLSFLSGSTSTCRAQAANTLYPDLNVYYSLLETEKREAAYHKANETYKFNLSASRGTHFLSTVKNKSLREDYFVTAALPESTAAEVSNKIQQLIRIASRAERKKEIAVELEALSIAFSLCFWKKSNDYQRAFTIGLNLENKLRNVNEAQYPAKREAYFKLGEAHYLFYDYHKSIELLSEAISPVSGSFEDQTNLKALKILGICYANIGEMEVSDNYFRATLLSGDMVLDRPLYNAYAISHLACNAMMTGQYDKALALSSAVWETIKATDDYGHLAGMCYCRGTSFLNQGKYFEARPWIDSVLHYAALDTYNPIKRLKQAYSLNMKYYMLTNDRHKAQTYIDTLTQIYRAEEAKTSSQYITRAISDFKDAEIREKEVLLYVGHTRNVIMSLVSLCGFLLASVIICLYRRKRMAYRDLALRAQKWAEALEDTNHEDDDPKEEKAKNTRITCEDRQIMARIRTEMCACHVYLKTDLTSESLSDKLGIHRNSLSRAVNRVTGKNFNKYVNEYRIKEAIRIISETTANDLYIDELYEQVGFNNRTSFYRAFKQMTGLSPTEFRKNS